MSNEIQIPNYNEEHRIIVITIGIPASGKSTWSRALMKTQPDRWLRINRDDIRKMLTSSMNLLTHELEYLVTRALEVMLRDALDAGYDVIIDNTSLNAKHRKQFHLIAQGMGNVSVLERVFKTPLDVALNRDLKRIERVGDDVIKNFAKRYHMRIDGTFPGIHDNIVGYPKLVQNEQQFNKKLQKAIICDLDGTLALIKNRNPFDATRCDLDDLNTPVAITVKKFADDGYHILFVSGRNEGFRAPTETFIKDHLGSDLEYDLFMRQNDDSRPDSIIKQEIFDSKIRNHYFVEFALDDRNSVVRMWREIGLTVFQVNDGAF